MEFKVEDNVKYPEHSPRDGGMTAVMLQLEVGQSFAFPKERRETIRRMASGLGKRHGRKFSIRGLRIWRIS